MRDSGRRLRGTIAPRGTIARSTRPRHLARARRRARKPRAHARGSRVTHGFLIGAALFGVAAILGLTLDGSCVYYAAILVSLARRRLTRTRRLPSDALKALARSL